jgi:UDP-N-acetylmuramate--alanine ligase
VYIPTNVHLVGVGGVGMSALASILLEQGKKVSGSDIKLTHKIEELRQKGAKIDIGHKKELVNQAEMVIVSTAIESTNPEVRQAKLLDIPVVHRSEVWAHLLNSQKGIAVAGANGKTTTASMITWIMYHGGFDPTYVIGGEIVGLGGGHHGKGDYVVAEADESDGTFLRYTPWCSVLTSIEPDHLEHYNGDFNELYLAYLQFLHNIKNEGVAVVCIDNPLVKQSVEKIGRKVVTYGLSPESDYHADGIKFTGIGSVFTVFHRDKALGSAELVIPGKHNIQNSLAAISACTEAGMAFDDIVKHLRTFKGTKRRFEIISNEHGILVVDDYAHHPSKIKATLAAARSVKFINRIVTVFQPHRYTRLQQLMDDFASAFNQADHLIITDIYSPPPEKPIPGISSEVLQEKVRQASPDLVCEYVGALHDVQKRLREVVHPGDMVITMGAGDVYQVAWNYAGLLRGN